MSIDSDSYREMFVAEARELLDELAEGLTRIATGNPAKDDKDALFRAAHSLKGMAATLGHDAEARLSHALEDHLDRYRAGGDMPTALLLDAVESLRRAVEAIAAGGERIDLDAVTEEIQRAHAPPTGGQGDEKGPRDEAGDEAGDESPEEPTEQPDEDSGRDGDGRFASSEGSEPTAQERPGDALPATTTYVPPSVRVDASRLDDLLDRTAALQIAQGRLERLVEENLGGRPDYSLSEAIGNLERLTHTLYTQALDLRTLPASLVTKPLVRRAHQSASRHDKEVELTVNGEQTQLDRTLLEALGDPLVHLLTNAVVHGIETPGKREQAGKPRKGRITVDLEREGGMVHVRVQDDGAGIDMDAVRERAVSKGHCTRDEAERMDAERLIALLCQPGFTTTKKLTQEAGRGVGLDAVSESVHRVGGRFRLQTTPGQGTTVTLTLPPSLSLIEILPVTIAGQPYAVPADHVQQVLRLQSEDLETGTTHVASDEDHTSPVNIQSLQALLGLDTPRKTYPADEGEQSHIVKQAKRIKQAAQEKAPVAPVPPPTPSRYALRHHHRRRDASARLSTDGAVGLLIHIGDERVVLAVDQVQSPEQAIVKPLHLPTGAPTGTSGAIVMRDGRVAVVLDLPRVVAQREAPPASAL